MQHLRFKIIEDLRHKAPLTASAVCTVGEIWEDDVFTEQKLKERLTESAYEKFRNALDNDEINLDLQVADQIANAMKDWALSKGATHFAHWFQPMHGLTAEKHDSFITFVHNDHGTQSVKLNLTGKQLIKGEPDASSFPNGGLRSTFEARGYTAWDMSSPAFIKKGPMGNVLLIPTAFVSWTGDALDMKTPLLRSNLALSNATVRLLRLLGDQKTTHAYSNLGLEQEFFVIDRGFYLSRPDLLACGRSIVGAPPAKGQQLEDHYFGTMDKRVYSFIQDVEQRLWRLGVPTTTRHNEVAPSQYEMAPIFEKVSIACDHNMIQMDILKEVSAQHGLACLLHEKPFAGVNGSGKHNNWSIATNTGHNLMDPGKTAEANSRFMIVLSALTRAVSIHGDLLRCAIAVPGNEHRLGENEAPPAIISIYIGDQLYDIIQSFIKGEDSASLHSSGPTMKWGVNALPDFNKDPSDRNRTSPFAFCGNKFEFRAVGASQSCARPAMILNSIMAESLHYVSDCLEAELAKKVSLEEATNNVIRQVLSEHQRAFFNGNGYSEEWREEANKRKLWNLSTLPDAVMQLSSKKNVELFTKLNILTEREVSSWQHVLYETLTKHIAIEADTLYSMASTGILPSVLKYKQQLKQNLDVNFRAQQNMLTSYDEKLNKLIESLERLKSVRQNARKNFTDEQIHEQAKYYRVDVMDAMKVTRACCDDLEEVVDDEMWPYPKYSEILLLK